MKEGVVRKSEPGNTRDAHESGETGKKAAQTVKRIKRPAKLEEKERLGC